MRHSRTVQFALSVFASLLCSMAIPATATVEGDSDTDVIVIMRDQVPALPAARGQLAARTAALDAARAPVVAELKHAQASRIHAFSMINAVAATVSRSAATQLASHPLVQAVVPDTVIRLPKRTLAAGGAAGVAHSASGTPTTAGAVGNNSALCGTLEPEALQLTNTAFLDPTVPQAQQVVDGNGRKVTGQGVRVAFLGDGMDTTLAGFVRPDGTSVFIDYQDFSGDPAGTPAAGGEAFGDASSIAAQDYPDGKLLTFDLDAFVDPLYRRTSPCTIQIRGMAPGASLAGFKVFSELGYSTISAVVQAIEWAVLIDDVNVINESITTPYLPDTATDPISLANAAAVQAGVTVVVSSGDAGPANTLESPATDPNVIAVGGSTSYRVYQQTGYPAGALTSAVGYLDNNISAFSSGGFSQSNAGTLDVVAPGEDGWALCSTNMTLYTDCMNFTARPTPIQDFGGTSESAPLTAGEAALVIQAYRSTHGGTNPSPALVKRIIMSTATDLGAPSTEQGAGLINALAAVNAALTIDARSGAPQAGTSALILNPGSFAIIDSVNAPESRSFLVTNLGSTTQHVVPQLQTLGSPFAGATFEVTMNAGRDPEFTNAMGAKRAYVKQKFTVPSGAQHLDVSIAYPTPLGSTPLVFLALLDPSGRLAVYSVPQGSGSGYGHAEVVTPSAGAWTALLFTHLPGDAESYSGRVHFTWAAEQYVEFGRVAPASFDVPPHASASFSARFNMPSAPGEIAAAIRFGQPGSAKNSPYSEIPLTLRTLIPMGPTGASFTGTLTGGNGRENTGPTQTFDFEVPAGVDNMSLSLEIADNGYLLEGLLIDPNGMELSVQGNLDPYGDPQYALQMYRFNPQPGRWQFTLLQNYLSSGNQTSLPFTARIGFNTAQVNASGLPDGGALSASATPLVVPILVTNTGAVTEAYFADARLRTPAATTLSLQPFCTYLSLPGACGLFFLPTEVSDIRFLAQSSLPLDMDAYNAQGYSAGGTFMPDIYAKKAGAHAAAATLAEPEVPYGPWVVAPSLIGPYGPAGAPVAPVTMNATALMLPFDSSISADSGDIWADFTLNTNTYNPLILAPGESGVVNITITPDPKEIGHTVEGYLYIDTYNANVTTGDEVVRLPYRYTIRR